MRVEAVLVSVRHDDDHGHVGVVLARSEGLNLPDEVPVVQIPVHRHLVPKSLFIFNELFVTLFDGMPSPFYFSCTLDGAMVREGGRS